MTKKLMGTGRSKKTKSRLTELEYQFEDLEHRIISGQSVGMEAITLYAIKTNLAIAMEDGLIKDADEERYRNLVVRIRTRIETIRQKEKAQ